MRRVLAICSKELQAYFFSPIVYTAFAFFALVTGIMFYLNFVAYQPSIVDVRLALGNMMFMLLFVVPLLTMRLMADEFRHGTDELLLTSPAGIGEIVIGKYLAALTVNLLLVVFSFIYAIILMQFGSIDQPVMWLSYLSVFLMGAAMMAVGLFASCLSSNQMVGGIVAFVILLVFWLLDTIASGISGGLKDVLAQFSLMDRTLNLQRGILHGPDIAYFIGLSAVFLVLSVQVLQRKRWR